MAKWIAVLLVVGGVVWVAVLWRRATGGLPDRWLDRGDQLASMISVVLTATGVVLAYLVWRGPRRSQQPTTATPAGTAGQGQPLDADLVSEGRPPRQLPREASWFTGRAEELERLLAMVSSPRRTTAVVISSIDGMAGIGKTALAVYAAHRMSQRFPDGQLFIDLHGFTEAVAPVTPTEALDRLLRMLGFPGEQIPVALDDRAALWRSTLAGKRMLIVLDNAATEAQVEPLLPGEPGCLVLVTSRRRLAGLGATHMVSLDTLPADEAVMLFAATAGMARLNSWSRELIGEAVELCGRLPLAIRIAAARLREKPVSALAHLVAQLRDEDLRLSALADPTDGGRGVMAAVDVSYQQLTEGQRRLYRLLGLHPGPGFDSYAAAALANTSLGQTMRGLDRLRTMHLLQEPASGRYTFHDLVRTHAIQTAARAEPEPDRHAALTRLLDHYRHAAAGAMDIAYPFERELRPQVLISLTPGPSVPDPAAALGWLDIELPNLLAVARYAAEQGWPEHVSQVSTVIDAHLRTRGYYHEAETLQHQALTTSRAAGHLAGELDALTGLGHANRLQGRYELATNQYQQALQIARAAGHLPGELDALTGLGRLHQVQGRYDEAADHLEQALQIARTTGHLPGELPALTILGLVHLRQGRYDHAADHLGQALQIARTSGHRVGELNALTGLGQVHGIKGRYEQATEYFRQALRIARATGHLPGEVNALTGLGRLHQVQGRYDQAADHLGRALRIASNVGNRTGELDALNGIGLLQQERGRYEQATEYFSRLLILAEGSSARNFEFMALQGLGRLLHETGQPDDAITHHDRALVLVRELGQLADQARAHDGLAHAYRTLHQYEKAREHWQHAVDILTELNIDHTEEELVSVAAIRARLSDLDQRDQNGRSDSTAERAS